MSAPRPKAKWVDLLTIDRVIYATPPPSAVSDEAREWARSLLATNTAALEAWQAPPRGTCELCSTEGVSLFDHHERKLCALCLRGVADWRDNPTLCDNDPDHGKAWRNPYTRRNEFFCGPCHAKTPEGVIQNRWARVEDRIEARVSLPLGVRERELCAASSVPGTKPCRGQVKPRGTTGASLCDQHAGKIRG